MLCKVSYKKMFLPNFTGDSRDSKVVLKTAKGDLEVVSKNDQREAVGEICRFPIQHSQFSHISYVCIFKRQFKPSQFYECLKNGTILKREAKDAKNANVLDYVSPEKLLGSIF